MGTYSPLCNLVVGRQVGNGKYGLGKILRQSIRAHTHKHTHTYACSETVGSFHCPREECQTSKGPLPKNMSVSRCVCVLGEVCECVCVCVCITEEGEGGTETIVC